MDGASFDNNTQNPDGIVGADNEDPSMGGNPMGGDPGMGGDPMGGDPGMSGDPMGGDPMGGDPGIGDGESDDTMSIINKLSDTDKEAVRAYAESMLSRDENNTQDSPGNEGQMMESVIFTKKQIKKIQEEIGPNKDYISSERDNGLQKKTSKTVKNNSPFKPKKFN